MAQGTDPVTGTPATPPTDVTQTSGKPREIAHDIRETRAEMDETLDAISSKLDPSHLIDQAKEAFTSSARDAGTSFLASVKDSSLFDTVKANPVPAAAVGLSLAWFLSKMGESESESYRRDRFEATGDPTYAPRRVRGYSPYGDRPGDRSYGAGADGARSFGQDGGSNDGSGDSLTDKAGDALGTAKDKASDALGTVRDTAGDLAERAGDQARGVGQQLQRYERRAESWLDQQMMQNPLAIGAVAVAAGALVGLSIPETDAEREAFGAQADAVKGRLADVAGDTIDQVKDAAEEVTSEAADKAKALGGEAKSKAQDVADDAASKAASVAGKAKAGGATGSGSSASTGSRSTGSQKAAASGKTSGTGTSSDSGSSQASNAGEPTGTGRSSGTTSSGSSMSSGGGTSPGTVRSPGTDSKRS